MSLKKCFWWIAFLLMPYIMYFLLLMYFVRMFRNIWWLDDVDNGWLEIWPDFHWHLHVSPWKHDLHLKFWTWFDSRMPYNFYMQLVECLFSDWVVGFGYWFWSNKNWAVVCWFHLCSQWALSSHGTSSLHKQMRWRVRLCFKIQWVLV